jgi:hypothetical protein
MNLLNSLTGTCSNISERLSVVTVHYFVPGFIRISIFSPPCVGADGVHIAADINRFNYSMEILLRNFLSVKLNKQLSCGKMLIEILCDVVKFCIWRKA